MKSEHRHELKTNELAEWLANLPQWTKQNLKIIIYVSLVVVVAGGAGLLKWYYADVESVAKQVELTNTLASLQPTKIQILVDQTRGTDSSYNLLQIAGNLRAAAQDTTNKYMTALALIKQGQALRAELHYRPGTITSEEMQSQLNRARAAYTEALAKASGNPSLTAAAKFGVGLCEEERGNFEMAEQAYRELIADEDLEGTTAAVSAKRRLQTMAEYKQQVVFKPSPKPEAPALIRPQIQVELPDSNQTGQ